jgi:hypothetical protein
VVDLEKMRELQRFRSTKADVSDSGRETYSTRTVCRRSALL